MSLIAAVIFSLTAQIFMKTAALSTQRKLIWLAASASSYFMSFIAFYIANKHLPLNIVSPVGTISVTILVFVASALFFKEVATLWQYLGLGFGAIAILFLIIGGK